MKNRLSMKTWARFGHTQKEGVDDDTPAHMKTRADIRLLPYHFESSIDACVVLQHLPSLHASPVRTSVAGTSRGLFPRRRRKKRRISSPASSARTPDAIST